MAVVTKKNTNIGIVWDTKTFAVFVNDMAYICYPDSHHFVANPDTAPHEMNYFPNIAVDTKNWIYEHLSGKARIYFYRSPITERLGTKKAWMYFPLDTNATRDENINTIKKKMADTTKPKHYIAEVEEFW